MLHREQKFMSHPCMSRFLGRSKLCAPVAPDKPVRPLRPVSPVAPVRPDDPVRPLRPVSPEAPVRPDDPVRPLRPVSPVAPVRPDDPVRPLRPVCPELPARQPSACETECCHCRRVCCIESRSLCPIYAYQDSWGEASPAHLWRPTSLWIL